MSNRLHGFPTKFERETVTPGTYAVIAGVRGITGPSLSREAVDATAMDDAGRFRRFITGLRDSGEVTLELALDPDEQGHKDLRDDLEVDATHKYRITFPDATPTTYTFDALVTRYDHRAPMDGLLTAAVTVKISGDITVA